MVLLFLVLSNTTKLDIHIFICIFGIQLVIIVVGSLASNLSFYKALYIVCKDIGKSYLVAGNGFLMSAETDSDFCTFDSRLLLWS